VRQRGALSVGVGLVKVYRDAVVENWHSGHVAVVGAEGQRILALGDPERHVPTRSCLKPFQALPVLLDGLDDARGLPPIEVAVMFGSHAGHDLHKHAVQSLLRRAYLSPDALLCGQPRGASSPLAHPCSGKHAGMLLWSQANGHDSASYLRPDSPLQQRILTEVLRLTRLIRSEVPLVTDGCGAPVAAMPLARLAQLYAYLAHPPSAPTGFASALTRLMTAVRTHPECLEGDGLFDTELCRLTGGAVVAKIGAGGVACAAVAARRVGVAVKLESGALDLTRAVLARVLAEIGAIEDGVSDELMRLAVRPPKTTTGAPCGRIEVELP
jgi:L-asparaginase II